MKKGVMRSGIVLAILLAVYVLVLFALPLAHGGIFWLSFVFTLISFAIGAGAVYIGFVKQPDVKSKFYGFPVLKISALYVTAQLVLGFVFAVLSKWLAIPAWLPVVIYGIMMGAAAIGLISADAVVEEIRTQDDRLRKDVSLMRGLQSKVCQLASQCDDGETVKAIKKLADEFRYSDPVSSEALAEVERDLSASVDMLQQSAAEGDSDSVQKMCIRISGILAERNRLCKLNK